MNLDFIITAIVEAFEDGDRHGENKLRGDLREHIEAGGEVPGCDLCGGPMHAATFAFGGEPWKAGEEVHDIRCIECSNVVLLSPMTNLDGCACGGSDTPENCEARS